MEAHLAPKSSVQVNKITSLCEICGVPHDTQYCMENPEQAFVVYASSRTNEAGGKCFVASQDARLSKFEADFKQQQGEMTNKIDTILKAINDRITGALPSDMVKNPKLNVNSTSPVLSARSYPTKDPQCSSHIHVLINAITMCSKQQSKSHNDQPQDHDTIAKECKTSKEKRKEDKCNPENINSNPPSPPDPSISFITKKINDGDVMFIEIIKKYDDSLEEELGEGENVATGGSEIELYLMRRSLGVLRSFIGRDLDDDLTSYHMFLLHY
ncbi:hypothetical protein Tco_1020578 [Tanacetum coccineum]